MKTTEVFKQTIKAYLDKRAVEDQFFAESYAKENKNLDECINYILSEVQKSGCNGFADKEIYGMAVHYYDEDSIKGVKATDCKVVVNHMVELTEEEKKQAHDKALEQLQAEQLAQLKKRSKPVKKEADPNVQQLNLF
jgi:hypothetical protein